MVESRSTSLRHLRTLCIETMQQKEWAAHFQEASCHKINVNVEDITSYIFCNSQQGDDSFPSIFPLSWIIDGKYKPVSRYGYRDVIYWQVETYLLYLIIPNMVQSRCKVAELLKCLFVFLPIQELQSRINSHQKRRGSRSLSVMEGSTGFNQMMSVQSIISI